MATAVHALAAANDRPSGGCATYRVTSLQLTGQVAKAAPGRLYGGHLVNTSNAAVYVKIYDKATAPAETDTPALTLLVKTGDSTPILPGGPGSAFQNGLSLRATTGVADNDTGDPGANKVIANVFYA